jgi:hypothetical protein
LNLADGPSRRLDYLAEQEAVEETAVGKLMPSLANKLAIAATVRAGEQYQVKGCDPHTESLIRVLSSQATTRSEARSAANDLKPFSEVEPSEALILEVEPSKALDDPEVEPNEALTDHEVEQSEALDVREAKFSTLTLIKKTMLDLI